MSATEEALTFTCAGETLVGILHRPAQPGRRGLVLVPGAPQYRVGSHRQSVLLARDLAAQGIAVLRFDYRGMGDSDGAFRSFEAVSEDIAAAVAELSARVPEIRETILFGLCDGASAIAYFAAERPDLAGLVLVNPWVRDRDTVDQALVRHYYRDRLLSGDLWRRLFTGKLHLGRALGDLAGTLARLARRKAGSERESATDKPLSARVADALAGYQGRVLLILSGADLTAQEFEVSVLESEDIAAWRNRAAFRLLRLEGANHTYARAEWRQRLHSTLLEWIDERD